MERTITVLDHRTNEWYPAKVQNREARSYILTTEQGCTISHNHIDVRPTNVIEKVHLDDLDLYVITFACVSNISLTLIISIETY